MKGFVAMAHEPGRHGFKIVGPFESDTEAEAWIKTKPIEGMVKELVLPQDWEPKSSDFDDTPTEETA